MSETAPLDQLNLESPATGPTGKAIALKEEVQEGIDIGSKLWSMANTLRAAGVRPADYQAYVLPLLMFKVVTDRFEEAKEEAIAEFGKEQWEDMEEMLAPFSIPAGASFEAVRNAPQNIGEALSDALLEIEKNNNELAGVFLNTDYAELKDKAVSELLASISKVNFSLKQTSQDALGQAYEYLLQKFADAAGAKAGQFFTPISVARMLCVITDPQPGESAYDPTCGSGGLLNTMAEHMVELGHERGELALYGQEIDAQSYAIASVNMFLHGNSGMIRRGDTLNDPKFTSDDSLTRFDSIVANPPFGLENSAVDSWMSDRFGRFEWGQPPRKPADMAFVAHMASSLRGRGENEAKTGRAAIVLPMGALFRRGAEASMRQKLLEAGMVDAVISLPSNLFYNTSIPACILVLRTAARHEGKVLFVDATKAFTKGKKRNDISAEQQQNISKAYLDAVDVDNVKVSLVDVKDVLEKDSNLSPQSYVAADAAVEVNLPEAISNLKKAEQATEAARAAFWALMKEYDV